MVFGVDEGCSMSGAGTKGGRVLGFEGGAAVGGGGASVPVVGVRRGAFLAMEGQ